MQESVERADREVYSCFVCHTYTGVRCKCCGAHLGFVQSNPLLLYEIASPKSAARNDIMQAQGTQGGHCPDC
jgi:hypothetical protein